jgi:predicted DNA-binding transcriptional regulator
MERALEQVLEALNQSADTISELAWELEISARDAQRGLEECVRRGWVVPPMPAATSPMPWGWAPYLTLTAEGEEALAEIAATEQ